MTDRQRLELGLEHHRAGRLREAEAIYRQILTGQPNHPEALQLLAGVATQAGQDNLAIELLHQAIRSDPNAALFHANLGSVYLKTRRIDEAVASLERALQLDPGSAPAYCNLGSAISDKDDFDRAAAVLRQGLVRHPQSPELHNTMGIVLRNCGKHDNAMASFRRSIALKPDFAEAHWNLGKTLLLLGDYRDGWKEYEWRNHMPSIVRPRNFTQPQWTGQPLDGRTVLLHKEQGFGDMLQFVRYAPLVVDRGGKVIVECPVELAAILRGVQGIESIITLGDSWPQYDLQNSIVSLPGIFGTTLETIPAKPYISAPPQRIAAWAARLGKPDGRLRIGLVWAGRAEHPNDRRRSMRLEQFAPLAGRQSTRFYSLQKGAAAGEASAPPVGMDLVDCSADLQDFVETAALIANLDLVICVDTAVAHLAAAMGKEVRLLLPMAPDWRWLLNRADSPWYPTMRLYRQKKAGEWVGVISELGCDLRERK